jgi:GNAT superfamily N-acetyltransferase
VTTIRDGSLDDVPAVARMLSLAEPDRVLTPEGMLHFVGTVPERARRRLFAAEADDGTLVGWGAAGLTWESDTPGDAYAICNVHVDHRRRGIGTQLWEHVEAHLAVIGAERVSVSGLDEPGAHAFAAAHGFRETFRLRTSRLELATLPPPPELPAGVELRPLADYAADPRPVYELDAEASRDIPLDQPIGDIPYDEWLERYWLMPMTDREVSLVLLADGEPAAFTIVGADYEHGRLESGMTGTLRRFRGRGFGELVKRHSLARARERGLTTAFTMNDETNSAMLRINERLGYRPSSAHVTFSRP